MVYNGKYVSTADIRANLKPAVSSANTDDAIARVIKSSENLIEMWCGRWFYKRVGYTWVLDGINQSNSYELRLPVPIINLTSLTIWSSLQNVGNYTVYNQIGPPRDDRWNSRIVTSNLGGEWFNTGNCYGIFPTDGLQNIILVGDFGFVEDTDGTTPYPIYIAAKKLALRSILASDMSDVTSRDLLLNKSGIIEEALPEYSYTKSDKVLSENPLSFSGDDEIDKIIDQYRYKVMSVAV